MIIPPLWQHLCDDAAIFPPGNAPLAQAVVDHERHRRSDHAGLVGPLVISAAVLPQLDPLLDGQPEDTLAVSVTVPIDQVAAALDQVAAQPVLHLRMLEVAIGDVAADRACAELRSAVTDAAVASAMTVTVEVPRDERRPETLDLLGERAAGDGWIAKFRTGGMVAEAYPSAHELATAIVDCVVRDLPFKCTAGLHRAIRHVNPETGHDEHGFGNLLLATHHALLGARPDALVPLLDDRDGPAIADRLRALTNDEVVRLRAQLRSFGTCSIDEPLTDLVDLQLLDPDASPASTELLHPDAVRLVDDPSAPDQNEPVDPTDPDPRRTA